MTNADKQILELYRYRTNPQPPNYDELISDYDNAITNAARVLARRRSTGAPVSGSESVLNVWDGASTLSGQA